MDNGVKIIKEFESQTITTINMNGRPAWLALEIGRALGYSENGKRLTRKITQQWSDEIVEGEDYVVLRGEELAEFKKISEAGTDSVLSSFSSHAVLLFESAIHSICLKTEKPVGKRLRRFLVKEVMPQLVREGAYLPGRTVTDDGRLEEKVDKTSLKLKREERLAYQFRHSVLKSHIETLRRSGHLGEDVIAAYETSVVESILDMDLSSLKPIVADDYISPSEIARRLEINVQVVGRIISKLGLRGDEKYSKAIVNKARGHSKTVTSFLYTPRVVDMVAEHLRGVPLKQMPLLAQEVK